MNQTQHQQLHDIIAEYSGKPATNINDDAHFQTNLGMDSIDSVQMIGEVNDVFDIQLRPEDLDGVEKVSDLVKAIDLKLAAS